MTSIECSLLITLPLFELQESEYAIVEEMCSYISAKQFCIPKEKLDDIIMGMYLNILEYVELEKQEKLMEMIDMAARTEGVIAKMKREERTNGRNEGLIQGEKNIILELLKNNTISEVSKMIHKDETEIEKIIGLD